MKVNSFLAALITASTLTIAGPSVAQITTPSSSVLPMTSSTVRLLSPEVSRSLKILRMPTPQPTALLIGVYWRCQETPIGTESCTPYIVACLPDQSLCAET
jgi:hypothetical protein